jgi:tight adherence protein C
MLFIFINISILFIFLLAVLLSYIKSGEFIKSINKKEHSLYLIYPLADYLLNKIPLKDLINNNENKMASIKALYVTTKPEQLSRLYWCSKLSVVMIIVIILAFRSDDNRYYF